MGHAIHSAGVLLHPLAQHRHPLLEVAPLGVEAQDHVRQTLRALDRFDALEREALGRVEHHHAVPGLIPSFFGSGVPL